MAEENKEFVSILNGLGKVVPIYNEQGEYIDAEIILPLSKCNPYWEVDLEKDINRLGGFKLIYDSPLINDSNL